MIGGTAKPERNIHIIGTKGEIKGVFDDSVFTVRTIDTASEKGWNEEVVDLKIGGDKSGMTGSHGGGDLRLVEDFVRVLQGEQPSFHLLHDDQRFDQWTSGGLLRRACS